MKQPKGNRRQVQKAETRALILKSAKQLFESQDYDSVTIRGVAAHAEIGLGTIYKHFPNKLSLLANAFFDDLKTQYRDAMSTVPEDKPFKAQFIHISKRFFTFYITHYSLSQAYLSHFFFYDQEWVDQINAFDDAYAQRLVALIRTAQDSGEISPGKDRHALALALISNYFFVLLNCFLKDQMTDPEKLVAQLDTLIEQTLY